MLAFESFLVSKGYLRFKTHRTLPLFVPEPIWHEFSTMGNIKYFYFHESDQAINLINDKVPLSDSKWYIAKERQIQIGLHERHKPATLIYPRPRIIAKRTNEKGDIIYSNQMADDNMNRVLAQFSFEEILEALYNREKIFAL